MLFLIFGVKCLRERSPGHITLSVGTLFTFVYVIFTLEFPNAFLLLFIFFLVRESQKDLLTQKVVIFYVKDTKVCVYINENWFVGLVSEYNVSRVVKTD